MSRWKWLRMVVIGAVFLTNQAFALNLLQITNVSNFTLGTWGISDPAISSYKDMCIYSAGDLIAQGKYSITVSSPNGFKLANGINTLNYSLFWEDAGPGVLGSTSGVELFNGVALNNQNNASILSPLCSLGITGPTARLTIKITKANLIAAVAGNYSGTITLLIAPA